MKVAVFVLACIGWAAAAAVEEPICACPRIYLQVCGTDGKSYDNECILKCFGVTKAHDGPCAEQKVEAADLPVCACPFIFLPVCGTDGKTYSNECGAKCAHVEVAHTGTC